MLLPIAVAHLLHCCCCTAGSNNTPIQRAAAQVAICAPLWRPPRSVNNTHFFCFLPGCDCQQAAPDVPWHPPACNILHPSIYQTHLVTKPTGTSVRLGCIGQHNHAKTISWHHREKRLASQCRLASRCRTGALGAAVSVAGIVAVAVAAMIVVAAAARLIFRVGDAEAAADVGQGRA